MTTLTRELGLRIELELELGWGLDGTADALEQQVTLCRALLNKRLYEAENPVPFTTPKRRQGYLQHRPG
jgi:hypothetical protein